MAPSGVATTRVAVVGGGIAGLVCALELSKDDSLQVEVLESSNRWGGQIKTAYFEGMPIELGAEGWVSAGPTLAALIHALGVDNAVLCQDALISGEYDTNRLSFLGKGVAAKKLGFNVAAQDRGRGLKTMRRGMASLIDALVRKLMTRENVILRISHCVDRIVPGIL